MSSYNSHQKSSSRAFDHLYDSTFKVNSGKCLQLNMKGLQKTAPLHILPCFHLMFNDDLRRRNFYFPQRNPLPLDINKNACKSVRCERAINTNLFIIQSVVSYNENWKTDVRKSPVRSFRSIKCQTTFRESETQTDAWLPKGILHASETDIPEIALIDINNAPGMKEIHEIERLRRRREWEKNLPPIKSEDDIRERIEQFKCFELEALLIQEKELNECQGERLKRVINLLEERERENKVFAEMMTESVILRNNIEKENKKEKMWKNFDRKMRKIAKLNGSGDCITPQLTKSFVSLSSNVNSEIISKYKVAPLKSEKYLRRELWTPKQRTREFEHGMGSERRLRELSNFFTKKRLFKKSKEPRCRTRREKRDKSPENATTEDSEACVDIIYGVIKGKYVQNMLLAKMKENLNEIQQFRAKFPTRCVEDILPQIKIAEEQITYEREPSQKSISESDESFEVNPVLSNIIELAEKVSKEILNQRILKEANELRMQRKREAEMREFERKKMEERENEIKMRVDKILEDITDEILEKIIPIGIEMIAVEDARDYVLKMAEKFNIQAAFEQNSEEEIVKDVLENFLLPYIIDNVSEIDIQLEALISANDAFDLYLKELPLQDINEIKIVCEDLVHEILNKIHED